MKNNIRDVIRDIFTYEEFDFNKNESIYHEPKFEEYDYDLLTYRLHEVIKTLPERESCAVKKRIAGDTYKSAGKKIINLGLANRNQCDGICAQRARQVYVRALRIMRHLSRKSVWSGEVSGEEWIIKRLGIGR